MTLQSPKPFRMIFLTTVLVFLGIGALSCAVVPPRAAVRDPWEFLPVSGEEKVELLSRSVTFTSANIVRGWVRLTRIDPNTATAMFEEVLLEFDCTKNAYRTLDIILYRSNGRKMRPHNPESQWEQVDETTNMPYILERMCGSY